MARYNRALECYNEALELENRIVVYLESELTKARENKNRVLQKENEKDEEVGIDENAVEEKKDEADDIEKDEPDQDADQDEPDQDDKEDEKEKVENDTMSTTEDQNAAAYRVGFAEDDESEVGKKGDEDPIQVFEDLVKQWNMNIRVTKKKIGMIQYLTGRLDLALKSRFS